MSILRVLEDRYDGEWIEIDGENVIWKDPEGKPTIVELKIELAEIVSEINLDLLRDERDKLIKETDWVSGEDVPRSIKDLYYPYRQALRDITNQYKSLEEVVWPEPPYKRKTNINGYWDK